MSAPWWGKERRAGQLAVAAAGPRPHLAATTPAEVMAELRARGPGFTPAWTRHHPDDPGEVLIDVYAHQHVVVAAVVDAMVDKARVEHLRTAGVDQLGPRALRAYVAFTASPAASASVQLAPGFALAGRGADGREVSFELTTKVAVAPGTVADVMAGRGSNLERLRIPEPGVGRLFPFGARPVAGAAMYLGLDAPVAPSPSVSIGLFLASHGDAPAPVASGGLLGAAPVALPSLAWEVWDGASFAPVQVAEDDTRALTRSGIIELVAPVRWPVGAPPGTDPAAPRRWVRVMLLDGEWPMPPVLTAVLLNAARVESGRTIRDEIIEVPLDVVRPVRELRVAHPPVLADSMTLRIDEGGAAVWQRVDDLTQAGPDAPVYRLDEATGVLRFGDGRHGRPLPDGFRHVAATYRSAETATAMAAGAIATATTAAPFLGQVTNPFPATGGGDAEREPQYLRRGPRAMRARDRAVALTDYETLALQSPGAEVRRAHAASGHHAAYPGRPMPGVVTVFVVGRARSDGGPPIPDDATLRAVADWLARHAPRGVEVVAASPRFHRVRVEATVEVAPDRDAGAAVFAATRALDAHLAPVVDDGASDGWRFGGAVRHGRLQQALLAVESVVAVPRLAVVVDGLRRAPCTDAPIAPHALVWPERYELVAQLAPRSS